MSARALLLIAAGLALLATSPSPAAPSPLKRQSDSQVSVRVDGNRLFQAAFGPSPRDAVATLDRLIGQTVDVPRLAVLHGLRGAALVGTRDIAAATKAFDTSNRLNPAQRLGDRMQFLAGIVRGRHDLSSLALDSLLAAAPGLVRHLELRWVYAYFAHNRTTPRGRLDDQRIALAKIGFGGQDGVDITLKAIRILLARGQGAEALELVGHVDSLSAVQKALVDRRFEPLWAALARRAGERGTLVAAESIRKAQVEFDRSPTDSRKRRLLLAALAESRRYADADRIGAGFASNADQLAALDEYGGWVVNEHARILLKMGRLADSDRRFADLIRANSTKPWIVSMMINRAQLLSQTGRFEAAAALLAETEAFAARHGNPYSKQLLRRVKLCTAAGLGRSAEIGALLKAVKDHSSESQIATIEALMCVGDQASAEKIILEMFNDPDKAETLVVLLQRKPLDRDDPSTWAASWWSLRQSPAIDAAFSKAGRDLPESYQAE